MYFDDGEFEIAIVTYNRADYIKKWLEACYEQIVKRNIKLSIYDSSNDGKTEKFILDKKNIYKIEYVKIDSIENIGYKPMFPIMNSKSKYLWVSGDSRYHDFDELDRKVFIHLKNNIDYICMQIVTNAENDGKIYTDKELFIKECFISTTCIGLSIYKTEIFRKLKEESGLIELCNSKFRNNYAFAWLGYFYTAFADDNRKAAFVVTRIYNINEKTKKQTWAKRFYESWCENVCELIDGIPDEYGNKELIVSETWKKMCFDTVEWCYRAWKSGGINKEVYNKYKNNGMLDRLKTNEKRVRFFAVSNKFVVLLYYCFFKIYRRIGIYIGFVDQNSRI